jgi:hypothetical protein
MIGKRHLRAHFHALDGLPGQPSPLWRLARQ